MTRSLFRDYSYVKPCENLFLKQRNINNRIRTFLNNNPGFNKQNVINKIKEILFENDYYNRELLFQIAVTIIAHQMKDNYRELWNVPIKYIYRYIFLEHDNDELTDKFLQLTESISTFDINSPLLKLAKEISKEIDYHRDIVTILSYTYSEKDIQNIFDKIEELEKSTRKKTMRRPKDEYMDYLESIYGESIEETCDPFNNPGLYDY